MSETNPSQTESPASSPADDAEFARNLSQEIEEKAAKDEAAIESAPGLSLEEAVAQADEASS